VGLLGVTMAALCTVGAADAASASTTSRVTTAGTTSSVKYVNIKEPFSKPGRCDLDGSTLQITNCYLKKVVRTDQKINQASRQALGMIPTRKERQRFLAGHRSWLKKRAAAVAAVGSDGTLTSVKKAQVMLKSSRHRLAYVTPN